MAVRRIKLGLAVKLAISLVASTWAIFTVFGYLNLRVQRQASEEMVLHSADRISDVIQRSTRYQMLHNDREALYQAIRDIGSEPGIRRIRIFNNEGRINFSTNLAEVGTVVDKQAEACYGCHAQSAPLARLDRPDRSRIFPDASGQRVLALIRPIENQRACSSGPCHAHPAELRVLGVIDTHLSLASVDAQLSQQERRLAGFTVLAIVVLSLVSVVFVWRVVHRPVKDLITGTQRVAEGDLEYRLPVRGQDELGELAASFNRMTSDLAGAQRELRTWAQTLEERVARKTEELARAHSSLVDSEKMASLGKLAATVAHEVNNPLFGILTYARLTLRALETSELEPKTKAEALEQLRVVERESRRCGEIMRNLLTFARQAPNRREPNRLNALVERALTLVRHQLELQGIDLQTHLARNLPPVPCDAGQIQQVILALLVNATEAMAHGGRLTVATEFDADHQQARLLVRDEGPGIPAEVLPRIFDPFFTTKEDQQRTGLGLAVARSILEQHDGAITVRSTPGQGAEFTVTLPLEVPVAAGTAANGDRR